MLLKVLVLWGISLRVHTFLDGKYCGRKPHGDFLVSGVAAFHSYPLPAHRDYLGDKALWSKCLKPENVVTWNLTLFSILLIIGGIQMILCAIQVVNGLLGTLCGDCQCCGCCGVSGGLRPDSSGWEAEAGHPCQWNDTGQLRKTRAGWASGRAPPSTRGRVPLCGWDPVLFSVHVNIPRKWAFVVCTHSQQGRITVWPRCSHHFPTRATPWVTVAK